MTTAATKKKTTLTKKQKTELNKKLKVFDANPILKFFGLLEFVKETFSHHQACPVQKGSVDNCVICKNLKLLNGKHR